MAPKIVIALGLLAAQGATAFDRRLAVAATLPAAAGASAADVLACLKYPADQLKLPIAVGMASGCLCSWKRGEVETSCRQAVLLGAAAGMALKKNGAVGRLLESENFLTAAADLDKALVVYEVGKRFCEAGLECFAESGPPLSTMADYMSCPVMMAAANSVLREFNTFIAAEKELSTGNLFETSIIVCTDTTRSWIMGGGLDNVFGDCGSGAPDAWFPSFLSGRDDEGASASSGSDGRGVEVPAGAGVDAPAYAPFFGDAPDAVSNNGQSASLRGGVGVNVPFSAPFGPVYYNDASAPSVTRDPIDGWSLSTGTSAIVQTRFGHGGGAPFLTLDDSSGLGFDVSALTGTSAIVQTRFGHGGGPFSITLDSTFGLGFGISTDLTGTSAIVQTRFGHGGGPFSITLDSTFGLGFGISTDLTGDVTIEYEYGGEIHACTCAVVGGCGGGGDDNNPYKWSCVPVDGAPTEVDTDGEGDEKPVEPSRTGLCGGGRTCTRGGGAVAPRHHFTRGSTPAPAPADDASPVDDDEPMPEPLLDVSELSVDALAKVDPARVSDRKALIARLHKEICDRGGTPSSSGAVVKDQAKLRSLLHDETQKDKIFKTRAGKGGFVLVHDDTSDAALLAALPVGFKFSNDEEAWRDIARSAGADESLWKSLLSRYVNKLSTPEDRHGEGGWDISRATRARLGVTFESPEAYARRVRKNPFVANPTPAELAFALSSENGFDWIAGANLRTIRTGCVCEETATTGTALAFLDDPTMLKKTFSDNKIAGHIHPRGEGQLYADVALVGTMMRFGLTTLSVKMDERPQGGGLTIATMGRGAEFFKQLQERMGRSLAFLACASDQGDVCKEKLRNLVPTGETVLAYQFASAKGTTQAAVSLHRDLARFKEQLAEARASLASDAKDLLDESWLKTTRLGRVVSGRYLGGADAGAAGVAFASEVVGALRVDLDARIASDAAARATVFDSAFELRRALAKVSRKALAVWWLDDDAVAVPALLSMRLLRVRYADNPNDATHVKDPAVLRANLARCCTNLLDDENSLRLTPWKPGKSRPRRPGMLTDGAIYAWFAALLVSPSPRRWLVADLAACTTNVIRWKFADFLLSFWVSVWVCVHEPQRVDAIGANVRGELGAERWARARAAARAGEFAGAPSFVSARLGQVPLDVLILLAQLPNATGESARATKLALYASHPALGALRVDLVKWLLAESVELRRVIFANAKKLKPSLADVLPTAEAAAASYDDVGEDADDKDDERI